MMDATAFKARHLIETYDIITGNKTLDKYKLKHSQTVYFRVLAPGQI